MPKGISSNNRTDKTINASYIAGFFDGEGSAMVLTIRRKLKHGLSYRIRPVIKIAQMNRFILDKIRIFLGYGAVIIARKNCYCLQINGNKNIKSFVTLIAPYSIIKQKQLLLLEEIVDYQNLFIKNQPYTPESFKYIVDLRDRVFSLNMLSRSGIKQKYSKELILSEHHFVDIELWKHKREQSRKEALAQRKEFR